MTDDEIVDGVVDAEREEHYHLLELGPRMCHWPVAEVNGVHLFCGASTVEGCCYCAEHAARAYTASTNKSRMSYPHWARSAR